MKAMSDGPHAAANAYLAKSLATWAGGFAWLWRWRRAVVVGLVLLYAAGFNGIWRITPDSALYANLGRSLVAGAGMVNGLGEANPSPAGLPWVLGRLGWAWAGGAGLHAGVRGGDVGADLSGHAAGGGRAVCAGDHAGRGGESSVLRADAEPADGVAVCRRTDACVTGARIPAEAVTGQAATRGRGPVQTRLARDAAGVGFDRAGLCGDGGVSQRGGGGGCRRRSATTCGCSGGTWKRWIWVAALTTCGCC